MRCKSQNTIVSSRGGGSPDAGAGGFTLIEVLVTMVLLTIVLVGMAGFQVATVRQVSGNQRTAAATRLAEAVLDRYMGQSFSTLPAALNPPDWETELRKDGMTEMAQVDVDGEGSGPFTVQRLIEDRFGSRRLITVRVSWAAVAPTGGTSGQRTYQTRNVLMTMERSQ